eukprot:3229836-Rhodomonas_salina.1
MPGASARRWGGRWREGRKGGKERDREGERERGRCGEREKGREGRGGPEHALALPEDDPDPVHRQPHLCPREASSENAHSTPVHDLAAFCLR